MAGNDPNKEDREKKGLVLQERDLRLFRELAVMRVIDREQAKLAAGFTSTTRANARLLALTEAGLLRRFFLGTTGGGQKALYALSEKSAQIAQVPMRGPRRRRDEALVADFYVQHQLTVNLLYCHLKFGILPPGVTFSRWLAFFEPLTAGLRLVPDGYVELGTPTGVVSSFLEVDLGHESLKIWKGKVRNYLQLALSGDYERWFGQMRFRVLVLANSDRRLHSIRKAVAPVTEKLFWFAKLDSVAGDGFFAPVWFRPVGNDQQPFLQERQ
jgi:hypothetical protein